MSNFKEISQSLQKTIKQKTTHVRNKQAPFLGIAFTRMIPNIATVLALCSGLTSMRFAYGQDYKMAVLAILLAAVFDLMDGRLARMLGASSEFGAELDSLSDFVSFGAAPALVLYMSSLEHYGSLGWAACLFFAVCAGFRLARFNILTRSSKNKSLLKMDFFVGVPAPMGAILSLLPLISFFAFDLPHNLWPTSIVFGVVIASGVLMVSRLPTLSTKNVVVAPEWWPMILLGCGITLGSLYAAPWITIALAGLVYLCTLPLGYFYHKKLLKAFIADNPK